MPLGKGKKSGEKIVLPSLFFLLVFSVFFREKKVRRNLLTWDLVLKISTREIQR